MRLPCIFCVNLGRVMNKWIKKIMFLEGDWDRYTFLRACNQCSLTNSMKPSSVECIGSRQFPNFHLISDVCSNVSRKPHLTSVPQFLSLGNSYVIWFLGQSRCVICASVGHTWSTFPISGVHGVHSLLLVRHYIYSQTLSSYWSPNTHGAWK